VFASAHCADRQRDYIKATVGFEQLGAETGSSPKTQ
jgi:hypothetical protein